VKRLEDQLADAQLVAPFDGQAVSIRVSEGRAVDAFQEVVVLADPRALEVTADLPGSDVAELAEGMPAAIEDPNRPGEEVQGHIRRLPYSQSDDDSSGQGVRVALDGSATGREFELGDIMRVRVALERRDDVLWLPPQAIRTFEGRDFVVIQDGAGQRRVDVKLGIESEDRVEIEEGLTEGQIIVGQ
jgi:RND family efflux transporter MFP subunit